MKMFDEIATINLSTAISSVLLILVEIAENVPEIDIAILSSKKIFIE